MVGLGVVLFAPYRRVVVHRIPVPDDPTKFVEFVQDQAFLGPNRGGYFLRWPNGSESKAEHVSGDVSPEELRKDLTMEITTKHGRRWFKFHLRNRTFSVGV